MTNYDSLTRQAQALLEGEEDRLAAAANFTAFLYNALPDLNWLGFYVRRNDELVLGPFQGQPACVRIPFGSGVCGTAAAERRTLRVADVHEFPGHIVCDAASRSEIVVPIILDDRVEGVLDIDSPVKDRFSADDEAGIESLCAVFTEVMRRSARADAGFI